MSRLPAVLSRTALLTFILTSTLSTAFVLAPRAAQADWPRFRGPNCTGHSEETGLIDQWPADGPPLLWKMSGCGTGYSSVSIVDGILYTMGDRKGDGEEEQYVIAFDLDDRQERWATRVGPPHRDGSRCTPTVADGRVYALGTSGDLVCLDASTGTLQWKRNLESDFGGKMMSVWRWSESPLVDGERLICTPGMPDAVMVALNKNTGELIWKCAVPEIGDRGKDGAGYTSMVVAEIDGVRQYITTVGRGAIGVAADDGRFLWGYNRIANKVANITTPVVRGNHVFVTTSYKTGSALLKLAKSGETFDVEEMYFLSPKEFENHHGGVVLVDGHIYGGDGQNSGTPVCLDFLTGEIKWKERDWARRARARGSAAVLYADGHLIFRYEKNAKLVLIEATPEAFRVKGEFEAAVDDGPAWAHPVIHEGKLLLRTNDVLMCYDLRPKP